MGADKNARVVFGDMMLGYGLVDRFSAYLGATLEGTDAFSDSVTTHYIGVFGTPVDSDHVDLDLFLDFSAGGTDQVFQIRPALELNLDEDPEMQSFGFYLRAPFPIYGRKVSSPLHPKGDEVETTFHLETTAGAYLTVAEGHQLLLEYDMGFHPKPATGERQVDVGGIALGYNVGLTDEIELIHQVYTDVPQDDEPVSWNVMAGFIATLPSAQK
jgi:hypothetical protein